MIPDLIVGVDTETTSLDPHAERARLRLVQIANKEVVLVINIFKLTIIGHSLLAEYLTDRKRIKIFHNAKFDKKFLRLGLRILDLGKVFDTMIVSQILSCGDMSERHNLKEVLGRYLMVDVDKAEQTSNWAAKELTESQINYAAEDAWHLIKLRETMLVEIRKHGLEQVTKIELDAVEPTAEMEWNGITLDPDKWRRNIENQKVKRKVAELKIYELLADSTGEQMLFDDMVPQFNIGSVQQLTRRMKLVGIKLPKKINTLTGEVKETTDMDLMKQIQHQHPVIPQIIEYRGLNKMITSYGENYIDEINPITKRIHGDYRQIGTMTARYTDPRLLVIPQDDEYRNCFVAGKGNVLVWGDYSIIELRILAELCKDPNMLKAFIEGKDLHTFTASLIFHIPYETLVQRIEAGDVDAKEKRRLAKDLNYGIVYGVGAERFAVKSGISLRDSETIIKDYFQIYPQLKKTLDYYAYQAVKFHQCRTMSDRLVRFRFNEDIPQEVSLAKRNGKNTVVQGTSADITKVALKSVYDCTKNSTIMLLHAVHDEIILEGNVELESEMSELLETSMINAARRFLRIVPVKVDIKSGPYWKK